MDIAMIKFSIVVVCLNPGQGLKRTVESILAQTCGDYEILVKDGMSSDGSVEALPPEERIRIIRQKDKGIYDAMNQAVGQVRGRYVYFLNCGDLFFDRDVLHRVKIEIEKNEMRIKQSGGIQAAPRYIFYGDIHERRTGQRVPSNPSLDAFGCYRNVPCHQACFYGAGLMREKGFDLSYRVRADYDHFLWCFFRGKAEPIYMPMVVADYEGGGFSETRENRRISAREHREIVEKYMKPSQVLRYQAVMFLSLSWLRTWLSENKATARVYNKIKRRIYKS